MIMRKFAILLGLLFSLFSCKNTPKAPLEKSGTATNPPDISLEEFKQMEWLTGHWETDVPGQGFYQDFRFSNDSTLEVRSYQLNGKDTSNVTLSQVYWKNRHLYMGVNGEWVVVQMTNTSVHFDPVRPDWNTIEWRQDGKDEWTMKHAKPNFNRSIKMKRSN